MKTQPARPEKPVRGARLHIDWRKLVLV